MIRSGPKSKLPAPPWIRNKKFPCPCGSERSFNACCESNIDRYTAQEVQKFIEADDFPRAEKHWRAQLTEYLGYVYSQTVFFLEKNPEKAQSFVKMDIAALDSIVDNLVSCLDFQGKKSQIEKLFFSSKKILFRG